MTSSPTTLVTVIADGRRSVVHASEGEKGLDRIAVVQPDAVDLIVAAGATAARGIETDALVAICRVTKEGKVEHMQIGGSYCRVDAAIVAAQGGEQAWAR
jgi:hypothetical protein